MITLTRLAVSLGCALCVAPSLGLAQTGSSGNGNGSPSAELAAFLAAQPKWNMSASVRTSVGYKDNLLLSFADEEKSPFLRGSVDFVLLRMPQDRFDFSMLAEAETTRYTEGKAVKDDGRIWIHADPGYYFGENFKVGVPVTGYYSDQVFDVSDTEVERLVAQFKVIGVIVAPMMRWDFHPSWWTEAQAIGQRKRYDDHMNDGDVGEGVVRLGWRGLNWLEAKISGAQRWRDFESRSQYNSVGRELPGTVLKISEREGELAFNITWDEAARWETNTRFSLLHYRDNGSGFFNFRELKVAQELEWDFTPWLMRLRGSASRLDYGVQTVGLGIEPPARLRDEYSAELYLERKLSVRWKLFTAYSWERSRSNDFVASYKVNEGLLGVRWSWEK